MELEPNEVVKRWEAAVAEARQFFGIDPLYQVPVRVEKVGGGAASIHPQHGYLHAPICIDLRYYQQHPEEIQGDAAHEVAHLMSAEIWALQRRMPEEWRSGGGAAGQLLDDAIETLTVRLERLFLRHKGGTHG